MLFCCLPVLIDFIPLVVLHREGEPRQRWNMCRRFTVACARLQPPHHVRYVAVQSVQRKPLSQRGANADTQQLHSGRLHHLRPRHGGQNHLLRQERRGERLRWRSQTAADFTVVSSSLRQDWVKKHLWFIILYTFWNINFKIHWKNGVKNM